MENLEEALKQRNNKTSIFEKLRFYMIPLLILAIFLGVLFIGVVPSYFSIKDAKAEIVTKQSTLSSLQSKLSQIEALKQSESQINADLASINKAFPAELTSVSEFSLELEDDALGFKLEQTSISSGEDIKDKEKATFNSTDQVVLETRSLETNNEGKALFLAIPAKLELSGVFSDFLDYLQEVRGKDKFIDLTSVKVEFPPQDNQAQASSTKDWTRLNKTLSGGIENKSNWEYTIEVNSFSFAKDAFKDGAPPVLVTTSDFSDTISKTKQP
ncbi:hypothetical protein KC660_01570 [Candidatus Dojkabacteria bacterium]|uniref:Uncharacterized protein n=1 Tax=Candidatus Dojkabacteria bacterium TaxID=2099670 RepID=A0A955RHV6_9BACT|nr:hypothetical protein [Candidatus Dojkabacteria bacterium]